MCGSSVQWASRPRRGLALAPTWRKQPVQGVYRWPNEVAQPGWGCADWLGRGVPALRHLAAQVVHAYCVVVHRVQGAWAGLPRPGIGSGAAKRTAARKEPGGVSRCRCWARPAETALPRALGPTISSAPGVLPGRKHPSSDPRHQPLLQRGQMLLLTGHLGLRGEYFLLVAMAASSLSDSSV